MKDKKQELRDELRELSPFLARLKEEGQADGFEVPPRYFRELPEQVLKRLHGGEPVSGSAGWWARLLPGPRFAAALAGVAVMALVVFFVLRPGAAVETPAPPALSAEDIHDYIRNNLADFDEELVVEAAGATHALDVLPEPGSEEEEQLLDEYYDELIRDLDEESIEEIL